MQRCKAPAQSALYKVSLEVRRSIPMVLQIILLIIAPYLVLPLMEPLE